MKQYKDFTEITSLDGTEIVTFQRVDNDTDPMVYMQAQDFSGVEKNRLVGINTQGSTSYQLALGDVGKLIEMTSSSANTVTVPLEATVAFPLYSVIHVVQSGTGQTTLVEALGVTILKTDTLNARTQNSWLSVVKTATNTWRLTGDVELL